MLSSKEVIEKTGISRATLNNYISLGILSKPVIANPGQSGGPRQLGYFLIDAIERIHQVQQLKQQGVSMSEIASKLGGFRGEDVMQIDSSAEVVAPTTAVLRVTLEEIRQPAYMINHSFELIWINDAGKAEFLNGQKQLPANSEERNIFRLITDKGMHAEEADALDFHLSLAKGKLTAGAFSTICQRLAGPERMLLEQRFGDVAALEERPIAQAKVYFRHQGKNCRAYATFFREGIFVVFADESEPQESLLEALSHRDGMIRNLLRQRLPVVTSLAVLVANLQNSLKICSELPPEEYFELINEIWGAMGLIFRKYHATCGRHVGDGMLYYFFPQPDSDYLMNALCCAQEMRQEIQKLSKAWQIRKNWLNELCLNTGITEGQEWLGTFQSATSVEFVVLGDTINQAARVSDFARHGAVWATKSLIGKLSAKERARLRYGVRRQAPSGQSLFVASSFSQVSSLLEQGSPRSEKLRDIATLPITEIVEISNQLVF